MKRLAYCLCLALATAFLACQKTEVDSLTLADGTYAGTFQRQQNLAGQISQVTLTFANGHWTGKSSLSKYPALCEGTYQFKSSGEVLFQNTCFWTADFDGTLILSGPYKVSTAGTSLELRNQRAGATQDVYRLTRQ